MHLADLTTTAWLWLALGAALGGFAKTSIGGVASLSVVIFAAVVPARQSTGLLLMLFIAGDLMALGLYRRHASWAALVRLLPGVVPGMALGFWFVAQVDNQVMRRAIGVITVVMTLIQLWQRWRRPPDTVAGPAGHPRWVVTALVGTAAGFATMTANAAGPVMTLYLIMAGLPMLRMLGTGAWFFFAVNLAKVPFSTSLHLITWESLRIDAVLVPALLLGGVLGRLVITRIQQRQFELAALLLSGLSALLLLR